MKNNDISFDDIKYRPRSGDVKNSGIVNFLIRKGMVKTEGQATSVVIIIVLITIATSAYMVNRAFSEDEPSSQIDYTNELMLIPDKK